MKDLSVGIYSKFTATTGTPAVHNSLYTALSGKLYREVANQNATEPYATFRIISDIPFATFTEDYEEVRVEFGIFTNDISPLTCETIYGYLKSLYDWCSLSISNNTLVYMKRINYRMSIDPDDNTISCFVDYEISMSKN